MPEDKDTPKTVDPDQDFSAFDRFLAKIDPTDDDSGTGTEGCSTHLFGGSTGGTITFFTDAGKQPISSGYLQRLALSRLAVDEAEKLGEERPPLRAVVAFPGDLLACETADAANTQEMVLLQPGKHVSLNPAGEYRAEKYGFVSLENDTLSVLSPLKVTDMALRVDWIIPEKHPAGVTQEMLVYWLQNEAVVLYPLPTLKELVKSINAEQCAAGNYPIVTGTPAVAGEDGRLEWLVDIEERIGMEQLDGRIDFRERNLVINVTAGQPLVRVIPPRPAISGLTVRNEVLSVVDGKPIKLTCGEHVTAEQQGQDTLLIATEDGSLHFTGDKVSVSRTLILEHGVNFETGNIYFSGDIVIRGSVSAGFSVQSGGNITISGTVENGNKIVAEGDISVSQGIVGKRTHIQAGGNIMAQNVNEAMVRAGGNIYLQSYSYYAKLRANGTILVRKDSTEYGGSILGGEAWATHGLDIFIAGGSSWAATELISGILPDQTDQLDLLQSQIENKNVQIRQILDYFGVDSLDLGKIRSLIEMAEGSTRKTMAIRAKCLAQAGKLLQGLLTGKAQILSQLGPSPGQAYISIREKAFPNAVVRIGNLARKLDNETGPVKFHIHQGELLAD